MIMRSLQVRGLVGIACLFLVAALIPLGWGCGGGQEEGPRLEVESERRLVTTEWLAEHLGASGLVVVDARRTGQYLEGKIPGAVSASFSEEEYLSRGRNVSYGGGLDIFGDFTADFPFAYAGEEHIQEAIRGLGIDDDSVVVVYDDGGTFFAAMVIFILEYYGHQHSYLLDGGFFKWQAEEREVGEEVVVPEPGTFNAVVRDEGMIVDTDYVVESLYHPQRTLLSSLLPSWHFGTHLPYSRPGHIPSTKSIPLGFFVNADRTWRSTSEIQAIFEFSGVSLENEIITYCGGGPLSTCGYFVVRHLLGHEEVRNYQDAVVAWLWDPRDLPLHLYQHPEMVRDSDWINWWSGDRIQTLMQDAPALVLDVRPVAAREGGHIPWSVHLDLGNGEDAGDRTLEEWAERLGAIGLGDRIEAVVCDEEGLTPAAAWTFWLLEYMGHEFVSLCAEGVSGWEVAGYSLTTEETLIAEPLTALDVAIHPKEMEVRRDPTRRLEDREGERVDTRFGRQWVFVGESLPAGYHAEDAVLLAPGSLVTESGRLLPGDRLWDALESAGVAWMTEVVLDGETPGVAAMGYVALRVLGFPQTRLHF